LDKDVGPPQDRLEQGGILRAREIEDDGFLPAIEPHEIATLPVHQSIVRAGKIALGAFDLDHAGARVGKPAGAGRRGDRLFERDHQNSVERQRHGFTCGD
jgi:hypothetical protein